jgi:hypothetical protein
MKPATKLHNNLAHQASKATVPTINAENNAKSNNNSAMPVAVRRSTSGANHSRMTLRWGKGWPNGMGAGVGAEEETWVISNKINKTTEW